MAQGWRREIVEKDMTGSYLLAGDQIANDVHSIEDVTADGIVWASMKDLCGGDTVNSNHPMFIVIGEIQISYQQSEYSSVNLNLWVIHWSSLIPPPNLGYPHYVFKAQNHFHCWGKPDLN